MVPGVPSTAPHIVDTFGFWLGMSIALTLGSFLPVLTAPSTDTRRRYISLAIGVIVWLLAEMGASATSIPARAWVYALDPSVIASALFLQLTLACVGTGQGLGRALARITSSRHARGVSIVVASGAIGAAFVIWVVGFLRDPSMYRYESGSFVRFMLPALGLVFAAAVSSLWVTIAGGIRASDTPRHLTPFWRLACVALSLSCYAQLMPLGLTDWREDLLRPALGVPLILALCATLIAQVVISTMNIRDIVVDWTRRGVLG